MKKTYIYSGVGVLSFVAILLVSLFCLGHTVTNKSTASEPVHFYGKVVEVSGDAADNYFSGIKMVRYIPCQIDGSGEFSQASDATKHFYSKPALASNVFTYEARVGDIVMIYHKSYKSNSEDLSSTGDRYNSINIALPFNSEPVP